MAKTVPRRKFITLNAYVGKEERSKTNNQIGYWKLG